MCVLFWGRGSEAFAERLKEYSGSGSALGGIRVEADVEAFRTALASQRAELHLVVLAPTAADDLATLLPLVPVLAGIPIILLLPSTDREMTTLAHRFHPRFVSSGEGAWADAASVAANILKTQKGRGTRMKQSNRGKST